MRKTGVDWRQARAVLEPALDLTNIWDEEHNIKWDDVWERVDRFKWIHREIARQFWCREKVRASPSYRPREPVVIDDGVGEDPWDEVLDNIESGDMRLEVWARI